MFWWIKFDEGSVDKVEFFMGEGEQIQNRFIANCGRLVEIRAC